ncbi:Asp23/Gls24 family envelope stress response protein [Coriobacteriales bacterium OH1046]|nr:Asp23/Gls24 family envelope stress response protein [Coriobacteriales bacterium OH1046]
MADTNEPQLIEAAVEAEKAAQLPTTAEADPGDALMGVSEHGVFAAEEYEKADELASDDSLTFSNGVIEKIVAIAMRGVPGVLCTKGSWFDRFQGAFGMDDTTKGVTVEVTPENAVKVNISILIEYGAYAPQVFEDTKRAVIESVLSMTGLEVSGVNLRIEDVLTADEYERYRARREAEARGRRNADEKQKETAQEGDE